MRGTAQGRRPGLGDSGRDWGARGAASGLDELDRTYEIWGADWGK